MTARSRALRLALAAGLTAGLGAGTVLLATPASAAQPSYVRLAHFSPDTPDIDVYLSSFSRPGWKMVLKSVGYGSLSQYQRLDPGLYTVAMRSAGAAESAPAVLSTSVRAVSGAAYTVAGVGPYADLGLTVLRDDLSLPPRQQVRVRVVQASAKAKTVAVRAVGGPTVTEAVDFARSTDYATMPAGRWDLQFTSIGQPDLTVRMPVTLDPGDVYSLLVLDAPTGGLKVETRTDAASGAVMPTGGVETGAGGTAPRPLLPRVLAVGAAVLLAAAWCLRTRRTADR